MFGRYPSIMGNTGIRDRVDLRFIEKPDSDQRHEGNLLV